MSGVWGDGGVVEGFGGLVELLERARRGLLQEATEDGTREV